MSEREQGARLRADARRNREQVLAAARDVFLEQGPDAPLDEIARRAGVGIGTLYRRFPDRDSLVRDLMADNMRRGLDEMRAAVAEEPDAWHALVRFVRRMVELRAGSLGPVLSDRIRADPALGASRDELVGLVEATVEQARADGTLREGIGMGDISLLIVMIGRPPHGLAELTSRWQPARYLEIMLDGLAATNTRPLPGRAITATELRELFRMMKG
ncbi:TetR/AcrR family transcriptional regulator [Solihabitans fulvus]|uniref:TetR/AcrR family transcriptional regulator n=1 Tax=Solihabitans fulvus TaxID=1892852 RepID=UPI001661A60B|nr:TetR/AcrR family transcriptional regulator [Solihabitans fulvus]